MAAFSLIHGQSIYRRVFEIILPVLIVSACAEAPITHGLVMLATDIRADICNLED